MARKYLLTPVPKSRPKRWAKKYKKRQYWFPVEDGETKDQSYRRVLKLWEAKKVEIDDTLRRTDPAQVRLGDMLEFFAQFREKSREENKPHGWKVATEWVQGVQSMLDGNGPPPQEPPPWEQEEAETVGTTVGHHIERFLAQKSAAVDRGKLSAVRYTSFRRHIEYFQEWIGKAANVESIDGKTMIAYHAVLEAEVSRERFSPLYARDAYSNFRQFVRWLYQTEALEALPRNFDDRSLSIKAGSQKIETLPTDEAKALVSNADDEEMKLYILLMLNCGMTQKDISDLATKDVDWKAGRIKRKRSKTENHDRVPVVDYPLWEETFRLLTKRRSKSGERALLDAEGNPLQTTGIGADGKLKRHDVMQAAYIRYRRKMRPAKLPALKLLRKTSASLLAHEYNLELSQLFLGHAPKTIAEKHYVAPDRKTFDAAVRWLGEQYGIE